MSAVSLTLGDDGILVATMDLPGRPMNVVGDALMAAYELMATGGSLDLGDDRAIEGIQWLMMLQKHFDKSIWLNPEPEKYWKGNTIEYVARVFDMYPLTLEGLGEGVKYLMRGQARGSK